MYEHDKIADSNFGINYQALAVLKVLEHKVPDFAEYKKEYNEYDVNFNTYPWYNGRERGIIISMNPNGSLGKVLHIAFFEHRNSDSIHCLKWETKGFYWNHPLEDQNIFEKAYKGKGKFDTDASFPFLNIKDCVNWIYEQFEEYYKANHKFSEVK